MKLSFLIFSALTSSTLASPLFEHRIHQNRRQSSDTKAEPSFFRLPTTTVPEEYDIQLVIDPNQSAFTGETNIWIRANEDTNSIVLHGYDLSYNNIVLRDESGTELPISNTTSNDDRHFLIITLNENMTLVENGRYELIINYHTKFSSYMAGLNRNSYFNENGTRRYYVVSHFQPIFARNVFPSYDEPSLKAEFNIHIYHPKDYEAISNTDVIPSTLPPMPNMTVTSFRTTPKMSTYLIALVVSDLSYKSNTRDGTVIYPKEYRIYAKKESIEYIDYALDIGQRSMIYLENYTDHEDRMPKLDNVALPNLDPGAMENWGLITCADDLLFYEKGITSAVDETLLGAILSHENSHFFFGNEVSPLWWDYLWLSEGFATYFQYYATDKLQNEWRLPEEFVVGTTQQVMIEDSTPLTHPMNNIVGSPDEVQKNFDRIAYSKAGSVVRMMEHLVGEQKFRTALSSYINSLPTGVSTPDILYEEIEKVVGDTIQFTENGTFSDIFRSWADQSGYPVVNMSSIAGSTTVVMTQQRFYSNPVESSNETWWIPFTWTKSSNLTFSTDQPIVISPKTKEYYITVEENTWYIVNLQQSGYYRVMYDLKNWEKLVFALSEANHTRIHPLNKAQLLDDAFTFSITKRLSYNLTLSIFNYLQREDDYIPWISAGRGLNSIKYLMSVSTQYELYKQFIRKQVAKIYNSVDFDAQENDTHSTRRKRSVAFEVACEYELPDCLRNAERILANEAINSSMKIDSDLEMVGYCYGLKNGSRSLWDHVLTVYQTKISPQHRYNFVSYLACTNDNDTIDYFLNTTLNDSSAIGVDFHEFVVMFVASHGGQAGVEKVIAFLTENLVELRDHVSSSFSINRIIQTLGTTIVTQRQIIAFDEFVDRYEDEFLTSEVAAVQNALSSIDENQDWIIRNMRDIEAWLQVNA